MPRRALALLAALTALAAPASGKTSTVPAGLPLAPARQLRIDTSAGTWMSLDLSPDGRTMVFDILGDLYTMPVSGGEATQLTSGLAFDTQPVFSPDGRWIAFVSDRSGADNLWVVRADGKEARQVTRGDDDTVLASPAWSADGTALFVSRYHADLNNYELWRYPLTGAGEIIAPIRSAPATPRSEWHSSLGAIPSPDGKSLFYERRIGGLDFDAIDAWTIVRRDLASGVEVPVITGSGGRGADRETFFRPILSRDGHLLAYATHVAGRTDLRVRDLASGSDRLLASGIDRDQLESSMWQDILPRYAFTPDGTALILSREGGFQRIAVDTGVATAIPFHAALRVDVAPSTRVRVREETGPVRARLLQAPVAAPDGKRLVFSALGALYVQRRGAAAPVKLATPGDPVFQPSFSPDGSRIAYVSWSEAAGGSVWTIAADGSGAPTRISDLPAYYSNPVFTPDGASILALRSPQAARQNMGFEFGKLREGDLVAFPVAGGAPRIVTHGRMGGRPHFSIAANTAYLMGVDGLDAVDLSSGARTRVARVTGPGYYFQEGSVPVDDMRVSPDGKWLLAQIVQQLYLLPMPGKGDPEIDLADTKVPVRRLSDIGADYFEWEADGSIDWAVGNQLTRLAPDGRRETQVVAIELPRDRPGGSLLLSNARVLTMAGSDRILDHADILVTGDRIVAVGPHGSIAAPPGAAIRDVAGKTVLPGFIDVHDHIGEVRRDVLSFEDWGLRARLAFGVTTSFDPSTLSIDMLAYQDLLDTGAMLGPRLRSTGPAIFSMNRFTSLDQVRAVMRRYRDAYGLRNIKEYRTGSRRVRQWVAIAAREFGMLPTTEGAISMKLDLTQILDGFAGNEHALAAVPLGRDVVGLLAAMRTSYTTTLMVTNSGPPGADWFVTARDPQHDARTRHFWPPAIIAQKLTDRPWQPLDAYRFPIIATGAAAVARAGGLIGMGAHGEVPGIGFHWEMEGHAMGGMTPLAVLHAATAGSAETIGRLDDLGTIEPGKLADLVILDRDPLVDIRNTQSVAQVMRGGRLYAADTLDEIWPTPHAQPAPWFADKAAPAHWLPARP